jgi:tryptophan synthase alpha chain
VTSGVARIAAAFASAKAENRGVLIPYLCAGDPNPQTCAAMLAAVSSAGADVLELGIPYGDPLADGPTIAAAAQRALEGGMTLDGALALARQAASAGAPPILMFTYFNPVVACGIERFADALLSAGLAGAIVPDVPLEACGELRAAFGPRGLALPLLIAPTTPLARAVEIAQASDGFVYLVSRLGVTSATLEPDLDWIAARVAQLRERTERPIAVGFGIATAEHVAAICALADGAIVGSALIDAYSGTFGAEATARARRLVEELRAATARGNGNLGIAGGPRLDGS